MIILSRDKYNQITDFINNYEGLALDCEKELCLTHQLIDVITLRSIMEHMSIKNVKAKYYKVVAQLPTIMSKFYGNCANDNCDTLLKIAIDLRFPPFSLCRIIIKHLYGNLNNGKLNELLKDPSLIPDPKLGSNVFKCMDNDCYDGPLQNVIRHFRGLEYEQLLKQKAIEAGLVFVDENLLRKLGYDKTPDLKLAIPCLYKGNAIFWIESKGLFGNVEAHERYMKEQYFSYANRFGPGLAIYWTGYLDQIEKLPENKNVVYVAHSFPTKEDITTLQYEDTLEQDCATSGS